MISSFFCSACTCTHCNANRSKYTEDEYLPVRDPLMRTQPFVLLRCIVRLLADQRSSIQLLLSDFAPAAQQFISVLNLLPSATAETVILAILEAPTIRVAKIWQKA